MKPGASRFRAHRCHLASVLGETNQDSSVKSHFSLFFEICDVLVSSPMPECPAKQQVIEASSCTCPRSQGRLTLLRLFLGAFFLLTSGSFSSALLGGLTATPFLGRWDGQWNNLFFGSNGPASVDVCANGNDVTAIVTLGGNIFGQPGPFQPFTLTGTIGGTGLAFSDPTNPIYGNLTVNIDLTSLITANSSNPPAPNIASAAGSGQLTDLTTFAGQGIINFVPGSNPLSVNTTLNMSRTIAGVLQTCPQAAPTATPTATTTPGPTATPTATSTGPTSTPTSTPVAGGPAAPPTDSIPTGCASKM